jgi:hypothetical protein
MLSSMLRRLWRQEEGQSFAMVVLAMVAFIGIIGLATDVGIMMYARRGLERLTDAAALAAASALSGSSSDPDTLRQSRATDRAYEYVRLNGFDPTPSTGNISITVTFPSTVRKIVQVTTSRIVPLAFMRFFGINTARVSSAARQGESVPLDVVLVMDVSGSQFVGNHVLASDANDLVKQPWPYTGDIYNVPTNMIASGFGYNPALKTIDYFWPPTSTLRFPAGCSPSNAYNCNGRVNQPWQPFVMQQAAAHFFIAQLDARYDKVAIVPFSSAGYNTSCGSAGACVVQNLTNVYANADNKIGFSPMISGQVGVRGLVPLGGTAMSAGINQGIAALTNYTYARPDAVGAMILLTDGSPTHLINGSSPSGCGENNFAACASARQEVMDQAAIAASKGIVIYTIFVGSAAYQTQKALVMQYVADLTDNGQLEGTYATNCTANAYDAAWFQTHVSDNFYLASNQAELEAAYQSIIDKIYVRLIR